MVILLAFACFNVKYLEYIVIVDRNNERLDIKVGTYRVCPVKELAIHSKRIG